MLEASGTVRVYYLELCEGFVVKKMVLEEFMFWGFQFSLSESFHHQDSTLSTTKAPNIPPPRLQTFHHQGSIHSTTKAPHIPPPRLHTYHPNYANLPTDSVIS